MDDKRLESNWLRRTALGTLAMLAAGLVLDAIPNPLATPVPPDGFSYFTPGVGLWAALVTAVAAAIGAYVARVRFVIVATLLATAAGLAGFLFLQWIAEPVRHVPYLEIMARNATGLACTVVAAAVGAELGWRAVRHRAGAGS